MALHCHFTSAAVRRLRRTALVAGTSGALLLGILPHAAAAAATTPAAAASTTWSIRSIDNMHASRDFLCSQQNPAFMASIAAAERSMNANFATVDTPYDAAANYQRCIPASPLAYETAWVSALRTQGLHVWFRQNWFNWEGSYGAPKLTSSTSHPIALGTAASVLNGSDTTSYLAMTYHFILSHRSLYANGDILTPESEPQNGGILRSAGQCSGSCQFADWQTANRWMRDSMTVDSAALASLGLNVSVGYWGLPCSNNRIGGVNNIEASTIAQMGVYDTDCYFQDIPTLSAHLALIHNTYNVNVVVGEWGDIWASGTKPATGLEVTSALTSTSYLTFARGFSYWQAYGGSGGEGLVDKTTLKLNANGRALAAAY
jgi:hypothetical protein